MNERPSPSYGWTLITKTEFSVSLVLSQVPAKPDVPAMRSYTYFTLVLEPFGPNCVNSSVSVLPSLESFQYAVRRMRPSCLRTTFQDSGPSMVMDKVVPASPG